MKTVRIWVSGAIAIGLGLVLSGHAAFAAEKKVTLLLGGNYCGFYLDDVKKAIMGVPGVTDVTFSSSQDHAYVTGDSSRMKTGDLVSAVDGVKGSGWFCTGKAAP